MNSPCLSANAQVRTDKASRYLKALCNHFSHKVPAACANQQGTVQFGFAHCEMRADQNQLSFWIEAQDLAGFERVKHVLADHLKRFTRDETLELAWTDDPLHDARRGK